MIVAIIFTHGSNGARTYVASRKTLQADRVGPAGPATVFETKISQFVIFLQIAEDEFFETWYQHFGLTLLTSGAVTNASLSVALDHVFAWRSDGRSVRAVSCPPIKPWKDGPCDRSRDARQGAGWGWWFQTSRGSGLLQPIHIGKGWTIHHMSHVYIAHFHLS